MRTQSFFHGIASHLSELQWTQGTERRMEKMALNFETSIAFKAEIFQICSIQTAQINQFNILKTNL